MFVVAPDCVAAAIFVRNDVRRQPRFYFVVLLRSLDFCAVRLYKRQSFFVVASADVIADEVFQVPFGITRAPRLLFVGVRLIFASSRYRRGIVCS